MNQATYRDAADYVKLLDSRIENYGPAYIVEVDGLIEGLPLWIDLGPFKGKNAKEKAKAAFEAWIASEDCLRSVAEHLECCARQLGGAGNGVRS